MSRPGPGARVAVIVPTHNYGRFLPDAVASLRDQTLQDWECVVVDDGSTDGTVQVLAGLVAGDDRIRVIRQPRAGVSAARNTGLRASSADYVQFLDADDRLEPEKLAAHAGFLDDHPATDLVWGESATFSAATVEPTPMDLGPPAGAGTELTRWLAIRNRFTIHSPMLRRSAIEPLGGFAEDLDLLEDWEFWMRCAAAGLAFARHAPLGSRALVRLHATSASVDRERMLAATVELRQRFERLSLPTPARTANRRSLARAGLRLAWLEGRRGRLGQSAQGLLRAARPLIGSFDRRPSEPSAR